jgi:hypothetical protein
MDAPSSEHGTTSENAPGEEDSFEFTNGFVNELGTSAGQSVPHLLQLPSLRVGAAAPTHGKISDLFLLLAASCGTPLFYFPRPLSGRASAF